MNAILALLKRETLQTWRQGGAGLLALVFFVLTVTLFPLGVGPEPSLLQEMSAGILWVAALLAAILGLDRMFALDYEDGSLDLLILSPLPPEILAFAKSLAHWINTVLPLVLISPLLGFLLNMNGDQIGLVFITLLVGTPALSFIGAIVSALTASLKRGGVLIPLLVLPLYIPTLIFGAGAVDYALSGNETGISNLLFLGAFSAFSVALGPFAAGLALKITQE